jgi:cytochrome P450
MAGAHYKPIESPADPYAAIALDRAEHPVVFDDQTGCYQVTSHAGIVEALTAPERFSSGQVTMIQDDDDPSRPIVMLDPPNHGRLRKLLAVAFSRRRVQAMRPRIEEVVQGLVESLAPDEPFDLCSRIGFPLPLTIVAELLGVSSGDHAKFREWSVATERRAQMNAQDGDEALLAEFAAYLLDQIRVRRDMKSPTDDLITGMIQAEVDGERLSDLEIVANTSFLLVAGNSTTTDALGNLVYLLESNPAEKAKLLEDLPRMTPKAVEEGLRIDGPVHALFRTATERTTLAGVEIPKGGRLMLVYGGGSHDPEIYQDADRFIIDRPSGGAHHLAFGWGNHFCLGAKLARMELIYAVQALYSRLPNLHLEDGFVPTQGAGAILRGWQSLDMRFEGPIRPRAALGAVAEAGDAT